LPRLSPVVGFIIDCVRERATKLNRKCDYLLYRIAIAQNETRCPEAAKVMPLLY
jgi:hypothetical protein